MGWLPMAGCFLLPDPLEEELAVWSGAWHATPDGRCVVVVYHIYREQTKQIKQALLPGRMMSAAE